MRANILVIVLLGIFTWAGSNHAESTELKAIHFFSSSYKEAQSKFIEVSHSVGARMERFKNPVSGPGGEPLYMDVVLIGSKDAKHFLVLCSGTHGVEGFAGSGIQTGLLREGIASKIKANVGIIMIHAINPYGFAYLRRFNEDNIDLNRNFVDHSRDHPPNDGYGQVADAIFPKTLSFLGNGRSLMTLLGYGLSNGIDGLKKAISGGQYSHPKGLFYGGQSEAWSNKILRKIFKRYLFNAKRVIFIDFHTGLGPYGKAEIIMNVPKKSPSYKRAKELWGNLVKTTVRGDSISEHINGPLKLAVPAMLPNSEVTAVSLEFGTVSLPRVFWALRAENWLYHHSHKKHLEAKEIQTKLLRAFYPDTDDWKLKVWNQGKEIVHQGLANLK